MVADECIWPRMVEQGRGTKQWRRSLHLDAKCDCDSLRPPRRRLVELHVTRAALRATRNVNVGAFYFLSRRLVTTVGSLTTLLSALASATDSDSLSRCAAC